MPSRCNKVLTPRNEAVEWRAQRGNSSVGRARPCQGRGRGFESLFPLQFHEAPFAGLRFFRASQKRMLVEECGTPSVTAGWQSGYAADCKSAYAGSIPTQASSTTRQAAHRAACPFLRRRRGRGGVDRALDAGYARARMAELADARDLKSLGRKAMWVRSPLRAPPAVAALPGVGCVGAADEARAPRGRAARKRAERPQRSRGFSSPGRRRGAGACRACAREPFRAAPGPARRGRRRS